VCAGLAERQRADEAVADVDEAAGRRASSSS
jgi:hypothetical protein